MKIECLLLLNRLLILNLIVYSESALPTAIEVTFHALTAEIMNLMNGGVYTVISKDVIAVSHGEVLSLKCSDGTSSEATLSFRPDDIYAYKLSSETHIVATAHAERSSLHEIAYCARYDSSGELSCNDRHRHTPPTAFVPSLRIDDLGRVDIHAVYYESGYLVYYNVKGRYEDFSQLPENCVCNSDCLGPVKQPIGAVIVRCDDGPTYLYELHTDQYFFVSPSKVKLLETSSYRDVMFAATQAKELCYQDILVERNMVTMRENASAQPFPGMLAYSSTPLTIRNLAIVSVNETEFGFLLQGNNISKIISYFKVEDLGIPPEMGFLPPQHSNITWGPIKGKDESAIFVEGSCKNGSLVLMVIEVLLSQTENIAMDQLNNDTQLNTSCVSQNSSANDEIQPEPQNPTRVDDNSLPNNCNTSNPDTSSPSTITGPVIIALFVGLIFGVVMTLMFGALFYRLRYSNRFNIAQQN